MIAASIKLKGVSVFRRRFATIGLIAALGLAAVPGLARAQTDIDQGKSPAEIFTSDCAVCHKTTRGLAHDKNNSGELSSFLREHYTASKAQAAALAAYVLGAGGTAAVPAAQKPDRAKTTAVEEPRSGEPKTRAGRPTAKPEEEAPAAKFERPKEDAKPEGEPASERATGRRETKPATASRGGVRHEAEPTPPHETPAPEPAATASAPATETPSVAPVPAAVPPTPSPAPAAAEAPSTPSAPSTAAVPSEEPHPTTSAAAPAAESEPDNNTPVPRDNIPD
jgi:hypothetical protein